MLAPRGCEVTMSVPRKPGGRLAIPGISADLATLGLAVDVAGLLVPTGRGLALGACGTAAFSAPFDGDSPLTTEPWVPSGHALDRTATSAPAIRPVTNSGRPSAKPLRAPLRDARTGR
jgi:hypothetical protein